VQIRDYSEAGLIHETLEPSWRLSGEDRWWVIPLEAAPDPETFIASIPGASAGQPVEHLLSAADHSGRRESLLRAAPDGHYSFRVVLEN
jgi:hypothetical protein